MIREQGAELTFKNWTETDVCLPLRSQDIVLRTLFHGVPIGNSLPAKSKVEEKSKMNSIPQTIDWPSDMLTHCLVIHHTDLISSDGVLLQFMLPLLVQLPRTGVSLHQVCTAHRARKNQWKYLQIDNHCFSKSRLALLLAIFDMASFKTLALDQEHEKAQLHCTEGASFLEEKSGTSCCFLTATAVCETSAHLPSPDTSRNACGSMVQWRGCQELLDLVMCWECCTAPVCRCASSVLVKLLLHCVICIHTPPSRATPETSVCR